MRNNFSSPEKIASQAPIRWVLKGGIGGQRPMGKEQEAQDMLDGTVVDPAVTAATVAKAAERSFLAVPANSLVDELGTAFVTAQVRWQRADEAFADAVPTTQEGALLKLRALEEAHEAMGIGEDSLELRHIRALISYACGCFERRDA